MKKVLVLLIITNVFLWAAAEKRKAAQKIKEYQNAENLQMTLDSNTVNIPSRDFRPLHVSTAGIKQ
ncbi:MAG: hypothetical protein MRY78_17605 [Saprospiraceae bacterium]|nr:hypothetical protein [Saprospiraceae bacterium]